MPARVIVVSSDSPGAGKTHVAAGLARWLAAGGHHVGPLHLSSRDGDPVPCPGGGVVCRAAALLAEACRMAPAEEFDSGWSRLPKLLEAHDHVVVEAGEPVPPRPGWTVLRIQRWSDRLQIGDLGELPLFEPGLMPPQDPDLARLPPWRLGGGPRAGVLSLPHITNFPEYQLLRGAEWLVSPAPGRFDVLFVPATSNQASDLEWLSEAGLDTWLADQQSRGAAIIASDWAPFQAREIRAGDLFDHRIISKILGCRVPPALPSEETMDRLGDWFAGWTGLDQLTRNSL